MYVRVVACYRNAVIYRQVGHFSTRPVRVLTFSVEGSGPSSNNAVGHISQIFGAR